VSAFVHRDVATWALRLAAATVGLAGAVAVVLGLGVAAEDLASRGEMFDGLGVFLGLVIGGVGLVLVAAGALLAWLARRRPFEAGVVSCVLGLLAAASGWVAAGSVGVVVAAPLVLGGVFVGGLGFGATLSGPRWAIDSPGGKSR
jgi:hypothetical protein